MRSAVEPRPCTAVRSTPESSRTVRSDPEDEYTICRCIVVADEQELLDEDLRAVVAAEGKRKHEERVLHRAAMAPTAPTGSHPRLSSTAHATCGASSPGAMYKGPAG
jgi:hypothetical protein